MSTNVNTNELLTEEEVQQLILTFWKMREEKAHLVDLMEVTAPDLEISMEHGRVRLAWLQGPRGPPDGKQGSVLRPAL